MFPLYCAFTVLWFLLCNALCLCFFLLVEMSSRLHWMYDRLPDNFHGQRRSLAEIKSILRDTATQQVFAVLPAFLLVFWLGQPISMDLPGPGCVLWEFCQLICVEELLFYFVHRTMHTKWLYGAFHHKHHTPMSLPYSLSGAINDPVDAVVFFLLTWSGVFFVPTHFVTLWLRIPWMAWLSFYSHSQLVMRFDPQRWFRTPFFFDYPGVHLMHHWDRKSNFGMHTNFFDWLFGTAKDPPAIVGVMSA